MLWKRIKDQDIALQTGDILETTSSVIPFSVHYGIVFYQNGKAYVSHNPFKRGYGFRPEIETLEDFKKGRRIKRLLRNSKTKALTDEYILSKSNTIIQGDKYRKSLVFNCEDYIREISKTYIGVDQRIAWAIGIALIVIIVFVKRRHG